MWTKQFGTSDALPAMCMGFLPDLAERAAVRRAGGDLIAFHSLFLLEPKEKLVIFISYNSAGSANKTRTEILTASLTLLSVLAKADFQKGANDDLKANRRNFPSNSSVREQPS